MSWTTHKEGLTIYFINVIF